MYEYLLIKPSCYYSYVEVLNHGLVDYQHALYN